MRKMNTCPVCGYDKLSQPAQDDTICPCCGTHFGYHDYATSYDELRSRWLSAGAQWFSRARPQPAGWNALTQLLKQGFLVRAVGPGNGEESDTHTFEVFDFAADSPKISFSAPR